MIGCTVDRGRQFEVLDEAHKLLELGFLEQCDEVLAACDGSTVQRCLFSATMPPAVEDLVHPVLRQSVKVVVGEKNAAADTVEQSLVFCGREDGKLVALRQMVREGLRPPVLIFVQSVERAMQLFHALVYDGLRADVLHAERTAAQREATVSKFRTDGGGGRGERRWHVMVSCVYSCMPSCAAACSIQSHASLATTFNRCLPVPSRGLGI